MFNAKSLVGRFGGNNKGSLAIVFAFTLTIVVGLMGGAIDFGRAFSERQHLQATVDAAALAGARSLALGVGEAKATAESVFASNYASRGSAPTPNVIVEGQKVKVSAAVGVPSFLLQVMGYPSLGVSARSSAEPTYETIVSEPEPGGDVCILLLDQFKHHSFLANGSSWTSAPTCEIHVKSSRQNEAAMINSNVHLDVKRVCVNGAYRMNGGGQGVVGPVEASCTTADDIFAGTLPIPTPGACLNRPNFNKGTAHLEPGTYCGGWNFNGNVKDIVLAPGLYILNNSRWTFNGDLRGTGVTIYFADSNSYLQLNGQGSIAVQAPEDGIYKGLAIYENPNITNITQITVNGGSDTIMRGLIYLPSRDMTWNGNSSVNSDSLTMVFNSLILNGNTTWNVEPFETWNIKAPGSGEGTTEQVVSSIKIGVD